MTAVFFKFQQPDGIPVANAPFTVSLRKPTFDEQNNEGILLPGDVQGITDAAGTCTLELVPGYGIYYLSMTTPGSDYPPDGCLPGLRYKFVVPEGPDGVRVEDLIVTNPTWSRPWDEQALAVITDAKVAAQESAREAAASADRATQMAQSIEGDAQDAREAAVAAEQSRLGAVDSATAAGQSAVLANQSKEAAKLSQDAASLSETNAAQSATTSASASALAKRWAADPENTVVEDGKESAFSYSRKASANATQSIAAAEASGNYATAASQAASSAAQSATSAGASAGTAKTEADRATTQASTAKTEADRSKTEADKAAVSAAAAGSAVSGKQDKSDNLTAFSGLTGAPDQLPYFTGAGALSLATLTAKAREFLALTAEPGMRTWLGLVPVTSASDATAGRLLVVGSGGILGAPILVANANNTGALSGTHGFFNGTEQECVAAKYPALGGAAGNSRRWYIDTVTYDNGSARQTATENFGVGTVKGRTFTRVLLSTWEPWVEVITAGIAQLDPQTSNGLMSSTVVNGWTIDKFLNGTIVMSGNVNNNGATFPANTVTSFNFPVPTGILDNSTAQCLISPAPYDSTDYYTPVAFLDTLTSALVYMRNGPTAQRFEFRVKIIGRFK